METQAKKSIDDVMDEVADFADTVERLGKATKKVAEDNSTYDLALYILAKKCKVPEEERRWLIETVRKHVRARSDNAITETVEKMFYKNMKRYIESGYGKE